MLLTVYFPSMLTLIRKIFTTKPTVIPSGDFRYASDGTRADGAVIDQRLRQAIFTYFRGSLAIREVDAGSTNAEEQELVALANPYYDLERFGIHFVASPRHADMLFVTGPVTRNMEAALRATYHATPTPRIVVAVGDGAITGGIFRDSYAISGRVADIIPVDFTIPGDPPTPTAVIAALLNICETVGVV